MLIEIDKPREQIVESGHWSMTRVQLEKGSVTPLQRYKEAEKLCVVTRGNGRLVADDRSYEVGAGSALTIHAGQAHQLVSGKEGMLEYLSFLFPPSVVEDACPPKRGQFASAPTCIPIVLPKEEKRRDGMLVRTYSFSELSVAVSFGHMPINVWQSDQYSHPGVAEYVYVVEGRGAVVLEDGEIRLEKDDLFRINPGDRHRFHNWQDAPFKLCCILSSDPGYHRRKFDDI